MAIYKLLKIHPYSVWADPSYTIEGMVFQSSEPPYKLPFNRSDTTWLGFITAHPLNGTNIMLDEISICGCTVKRLFK